MKPIRHWELHSCRTVTVIGSLLGLAGMAMASETSMGWLALMVGGLLLSVSGMVGMGYWRARYAGLPKKEALIDGIQILD